jgi:AcrR family transcriptional regulator
MAMVQMMVAQTAGTETALSKHSTPTAARIDGRRLRSVRTKQLIVEAYLALASEKSPQVPTAAQIAERAGYSVRSVFERFPDIHSLQVAAVDYALVQVAALAPSRDTDGDRRAISDHTSRRAPFYGVAPLWRVVIANQGRLTGSKADPVHSPGGRIEPLRTGTGGSPRNGAIADRLRHWSTSS